MQKKEEKPLKILFFGAGSIGKRHISLIKRYFSHEIYLHKKCGWKALDKQNFDVAFICNITPLHIKTAIRCAEHGLHLFIEKPIGIDTKDLDTLLSLVDKNRLSTYVAYQFRHHPIIKGLKGWLLTEPRKIVCKSDASKWPSRRKLNDVLFELSHEIDYSQYLFGPIKFILGYHNNDEASLTLHHDDGSLTDLELSINSTIEERYIQIAGARFDIKNVDRSYLKQLEYFFNNLENPRMMNNIFDASELYRKIVDFLLT